MCPLFSTHVFIFSKRCLSFFTFLPILSLRLSVGLSGSSTCVFKPRRQMLSPPVGVALDFVFASLNYSRLHSFFNQKCFNPFRAQVIITLKLLCDLVELRSKFPFTRMCFPFLDALHIFLCVLTPYPLIIHVFCYRCGISSIV